ncbi:MBL fold metallo-hydrolase [Poritiphilus flavus]|uniref:Metallo-beta-lactamase domain-containing protein 1 n=1 Tax=Poritiphilus flavus TaxID=2697053 RepID=A0A6L9EDW3_9FLAO|nr:MBL fold metallo-hydrolase [Poritiphilus flavus]NAS12944.1 MBL fold metallo-hydrolase [Poritiphilus flavus]
MAKIKVLVEGYAIQLDKGWRASSTVCLIITEEEKKIITDPGCNREALLQALSDEGLNTSDIDYVFLSHRHPDHVLLAGIFESARYITFDANLMYDRDLMLEFDRHVLGDDIEIVHTPGHVAEHLSLIVNTPQGKVAVAGDVIWWLDTEEQIFDLNQPDHSHALDMDMQALVQSRKTLIRNADYIIPGHGKMLKVDKKVLG